MKVVINNPLKLGKKPVTLIPTPINITENTASRCSRKSNKTYTFDLSNQRMCVIYPHNYNDFSNITDQNGYNITSSFIISTFTYIRDNLEPVLYKLYYNDSDLILGNFSVTFNF